MRKNALVFITTYLGCNPYSDKLSLESLKEKLKEEGEKLAALKEELPQHAANSELIFGSFIRSTRFFIVLQTSAFFTLIFLLEICKIIQHALPLKLS